MFAGKKKSSSQTRATERRFAWNLFFSRSLSLTSGDKLSEKNPRSLTPIPAGMGPRSSLREGKKKPENNFLEGMAKIIETTIRENESGVYHCQKKPIYEFLKRVRRWTCLHPYCFVAALRYLHRIVWSPVPEYSSMEVRPRLPKNRLVLTSRNWKLLVTTAIMVAQKNIDDESYLNKDFVVLLGPAYNIKQLNKMESTFLGHLNWDCSFTPQECAVYYRWIRALA